MRHAQARGATGVVYGGSVHAPALGRVATAAQHLGLDCTLVLGSRPDSAVKHPTVLVAVQAGAALVRSPAPYNPALQRVAAKIAADSDGDVYQVPYGISTPANWTPEQVAAFLDVDAPQVTNLPDSVETVVIAFGSGNAAAAMLHALLQGHGPASLRRVVLAGVGPDRQDWLDARLDFVGTPYTADAPFELTHYPLHPGFAEYIDRMPETLDGIRLHPTYEGKVARYFNQLQPEWWQRRDGSTCFWIVGGP